MLVVTLLLCITPDFYSAAPVVSIDPTSVTVIENEEVAFTCTATVQGDWRNTRFMIDSKTIVNFIPNKGNCFIGSHDSNSDYNGTCGTSNGLYILRILRIDNQFHDQSVHCIVRYGEGGAGDTIIDKKSDIYVLIPIKSIVIKPDGVDQVVSVLTGENLSFTCTTNSGRPAAWIQWYINGWNVTNNVTSNTTTDGSKVISTSTLIYSGNSADHNKVVNCDAVNIEGGEKIRSLNKTIYIILPVTTIALDPAGDDLLSVVLGENFTFTCTTGTGRPAALIQWYIGERNLTNQANTVTSSDNVDSTKFKSTSTLVYKGNDSEHDQEIYCEAINTVKRQKVNTENRTVYIIVPVISLTISPVENNKRLSVISGEKLQFVCSTNSIRPEARIQWYIGGQNMTYNAIKSTVPDKTDKTKCISKSTLMYTGRDADHDKVVYCEALNIEGREKTQSIETSLFILRSPTVDGNQELSEKVYVGTKGSLNLTVILIANPPPKVKWTFTNETAHNYNISRIDFNITSYNVFRHVILYEKATPHQTDFGNYTIEAVNSIGPTFVHTFIVEPAQAPSKPLSMDAECDLLTPRINVSWKSNFDGGKPQHFTVFLINAFTGSLIRSPIILDKGQNEIHFHTHNLDYETNYMMFVEARNAYGAENTSDLVNCTTSTKPSLVERSSSAVVGGAAGSSAAVIAITIVAVGVVLRRRTRKEGDDKQNLNRFNKKEIKQDEDNEGVLENNPLYGTSSISTKTDVYSQVNHTRHEMKEPTDKSRNKVQKTKMKGNQQKGIELDVYENSEDLGKAFDKNIYGNVHDQSASPVISPISGNQIKKNKDGLIYADLEFAPAESRKKFVVKGSENRTNYAMIDLTKKADPLPDDSDEDCKTGSE